MKQLLTIEPMPWLGSLSKNMRKLGGSKSHLMRTIFPVSNGATLRNGSLFKFVFSDDLFRFGHDRFNAWAVNQRTNKIKSIGEFHNSGPYDFTFNGDLLHVEKVIEY